MTTARGASSAARVSRPSTAAPTANRSGRRAGRARRARRRAPPPAGRELVQQWQQRGAELVEATEGDLALGLHAPGREDPHRRGPGTGVVEQPGLADAGIAGDDQHATVSDPGPGKQLLDDPLLNLAPHEHPVSVTRSPPDD